MFGHFIGIGCLVKGVANHAIKINSYQNVLSGHSQGLNPKHIIDCSLHKTEQFKIIRIADVFKIKDDIFDVRVPYPINGSIEYRTRLVKEYYICNIPGVTLNTGVKNFSNELLFDRKNTRVDLAIDYMSNIGITIQDNEVSSAIIAIGEFEIKNKIFLYGEQVGENFNVEAFSDSKELLAKKITHLPTVPWYAAGVVIEIMLMGFSILSYSAPPF